jgi:hypothetical protein
MSVLIIVNGGVLYSLQHGMQQSKIEKQMAELTEMKERDTKAHSHTCHQQAKGSNLCPHRHLALQ